MTTTLFVMPLKKGKKADYLKFIQECMGPKKADYEDLLKRYKLNSVRMWTQTLDGKDYAMFVHDMDDDAGERLAGWSTSTNPFDQWFDKHLRECYEVESFDDMPPQPVFFGELDTRKKK